MLLLIDNYDSFSYNLYQYLGTLDPDIRVIRNDELTVPQIRALRPAAIVLSPGPGRPEDAGVCIDVVRELGPEIPILGVCLGHQAICTAYGAIVTYARTLMHGKDSALTFTRDAATGDPVCPLFKGLPDGIRAARYHSLAADKDTIPPVLVVTATADDGEIMGVQHVEFPVFGLQFHPESIMTEDGMDMLRNFLTFAESFHK